MKDLLQQQQENREKMDAGLVRAMSLGPEIAAKDVLDSLDTLTASTWKAAEEETLRRVEALIGKHNAAILNGYQLAGLGDERALYGVITDATNATLAALEELSERKV